MQINVTLPTTQKTRRRFLPLFSALIAAAVVLFIIGSAVVMFSNAGYNRNTVTGQAGGHNNNTKQPTAVPVVNTPGIYITTLKKDHNVAVSRVDASTHKVLWSYEVPEASDITTYSNTVYVSSVNMQVQPRSRSPILIAIDATSGKLRWNVDLGPTLRPFASQYSSSLSSPYDTISTPTVVDGLVYVIDRAGIVLALNVDTGKVRWSFNTGASAIVDGTNYGSSLLTVQDGVVYGAQHNTLFALDAKNGTKLWTKVTIATDQIYGNVQVVDGTIYTSSMIVSEHISGMSMLSYVYAYSAHDGHQLWQRQYQNWITAGITVDNGLIFFVERKPDLGDGTASTSTIHALTIAGKEVWHKAINTDIAGISVSNGYVSYINSQYQSVGIGPNQIISATLYVFKGSDGSTLVQKALSTQSEYVLDVIQNNTLYLTDLNRHLVAYDPQSGKVLWSGIYGEDIVDTTGTHNAGVRSLEVVP
jgi:outer membrane protein assembly factor BamB